MQSMSVTDRQKDRVAIAHTALACNASHGKNKYDKYYRHVSAWDVRSGAYRRLYDAVHRRSILKPDEFWGEAAEDIVWFKRWDKVLDDSESPFTKW